MKGSILLGLGFLAQGLFSARFLIQLVKSEKKGEVLSPSIFWQLSLVASALLMIYGAFRHDLAIFGGQILGYFVYIRNLQIQGEWKKFPKLLQAFFFSLPVLFTLYFIFFWNSEFLLLLNNPDISYFLLTWGSLGQLVFTSRFLIQWYYSEKSGKSYFPPSFWYISIFGALLITSYAIIRKDAVLFIGQAFGLIVYLRNIMIHFGYQNRSKVNFLEKIIQYRMGLFLGVTSFFLFFNLNVWSVTETSEARYSQISKEMVQTGEWLHPQLMGIYHYHKPPMTYWITAVSYQLFGINSFAARFFLQIAVLLQILLIYQLGKMVFEDKSKAFKSALLYASFPVVIIGSRALTTDTYLATFLLAAIYFWFRYSKTGRKSDNLLFYLFLGLGFLTKGPVILLVPVSLWAYRVFTTRKFQVDSNTLFGILVFLVIGLSWFLMLFREDSRFFDYFVLRQTVERFSSDVFHRTKPFWYYIPILLLAAFPWFLILLYKTKSIFSGKIPIAAKFWVWVFVPLLIFSLSHSKLILYILPLFGGLAIASIAIWDKMNKRVQKKWGIAQTIFQVIVILTLFLSPYFVEGLYLNLKFYFLGVILLCLLLGMYLSGIKNSDRVLISTWIFTMMLTGMSTYVFSNNSKLVNDTKKVTAWIEEHTDDSTRIVIFDKILPSVPFETERSVISIYYGDESLNRETQFQRDDSWKNSLIDLKNQPEWITQKSNQEGLWIAKATKTLPALPDSLDWKVLEEVDGWKIMEIARKEP
ncbi:4-amino-4-deoxy-L-arabinose transferase-like glycosyltransferase [Algoriphagus boseongensis]|uniref:4-amino-4-deoxy-L-arabinose transferase-like glycosyltransferase n=1 Tax=Algoriphagus boseongensis TaxID=1442587 RepID=A0A4R6T9P0_9BACT|nr:lipid-A-disaccharide synthase N-terminal domain-containing protein [Algoriphagus boseongensis]TDQ18265.1 4-amino-4-deoxy-L-arabinose transferase-like glycosyltransferase [Algoriphagus boseongensis]